MAQDERAHGCVEVQADEVGDGIVRQVADAAHHALLDGPGIGADFQHVDIVVRFEQKQVHRTQVEPYGIGDVAEVGDQAGLEAVAAEAEGHGVGGVVGDGEGVDFEVADDDAGAGLKGLDSGVAAVPVDGGGGQIGQENGNAQGLGDDGKAGDVVGVLVGDQDGVDAVEFLAEGGQAATELAAAEAGVDEQARAAGGDQGRVSGTSASEY